MIKRTAVAGVAAAVLLAGVGASEVESADSQKRFSVRGLGTTTCSKYLEARNLNVRESEQYAHWFTGFITAYNWKEPDTFDISHQYKSNGLLRYLDLYCGNNPTKRIIDASTEFVRAVYEKRQKAGS